MKTKTRARHAWEALSSSYWFVPMLMLASAAAMSAGMLALDRWLGDREAGVPGAYTGGSDGARLLLSTVASSVITVAGVVFSITIAALTQASTQFGPRLLRNFMRDRGNQVVLGTFVATFLYCLLVLRTIRGEDYEGFVPHVAVTVGVATAIASLCVLVYFVHHVSSSLQAPQVIARVAEELREAIDRLCPRVEDRGSQPRDTRGDDRAPPTSPDASRCIGAAEGGYIQAIDVDDLVEIARQHALVLRVLRRPGHFVARGEPVVLVSPTARIDDPCRDAVRAAFIVGTSRTAEQDLEFAIEQLVEIAVRSLSAGVNDPTTAMTCVDWLADSLARLAEAELPRTHHYDEDGDLRAILDVPTFDGIVGAAFDQIRQYGRASVPVTMRLLEAIGRIAPAATPEQRAALRQQADMILRHSAGFPETRDRAAVGERHREACRALA